ncbi:MAG: hypothetical protein NTX27_18080 [Verrucomicrobia bacterium]|jgi:hypothetical protein|nr:hypothetical protein [Verrucomicrobiota bacterium]
MKTIWKVGLVLLGVIMLAADARAGRWLSHDPIQEGVGFVDRDAIPDFDPVFEPRNEPNLYAFVGNDGISYLDPLGLWKIDRNGSAKAPVLAEPGDTIGSLAGLIGLSASEYQRWLTLSSGTAMPGSSSQRLGGCEKFEIPNTVVAYWAGWGGGIGRWYVTWNSSVNYLRARGFNVDNHHHQAGDTMGLQKMFTSKSMAKELQGVFFWGHGGPYPYPAQYLVSQSGDAVLAFSSPGLYYHMALGLVFACDSNSGKSALMSGSGGEIWHGYTGTLYPVPFRRYHAKHFIKPGQQATH